MNKKIFTCIGIVLFLLFSLNLVYGQNWTDKSFEDFSKGTLDASGQNIFVDKQGSLRVIRRFDVNKDGYIDLLFNNTHDDDVFVSATFASVGKDREIISQLFPINGSIAAETADLNNDGFMDIIFCPNQSGIQNPRRLITIMWGGEDGWTTARSNGILPVNNVKSLTTADINGDGWLDIVTLNSSAWLPNQPQGNIIRVYLGGEDGFLLSKFQDIGIEKANKLVANDFDKDGVKDIAVLTEDNTIKVIWSKAKSEGSVTEFAIDTIKLDISKNSAISLAEGDIDNDGKIDFIVGTNKDSVVLVKGEGNRRFTTSDTIEGVYASSITIADLDGDKNLDLITSKFSMRKAAGGEMLGGAKIENDNVTVLWGQNGQFSAQRSLELDAPYTAATAVVDIDGDGILDVVCATHQGEKKYATESAIFYGKKNRRFEKGTTGIPSEGASHVAVIPETKNNKTSVVVSNSRTGTLNETVPLSLYFGSKDGFKSDNLIEIPFSSGYESSAADLNGDGF